MPFETLLVVAAIVVIAAVALFVLQRKRNRENLRQHFGPEYEEALRRHGSPAKAEADLAQRAKRIRKYQIRSLSPQEQDRFHHEWTSAQSLFVDNPARSVHVADELVCRVMEARGYPMTDFEQRAEDLSVDHPHIVRNYRISHNIAVAADTGRATTEDLRRAMVAYRELFGELLETHQPEEIRR